MQILYLRIHKENAICVYKIRINLLNSDIELNLYFVITLNSRIKFIIKFRFMSIQMPNSYHSRSHKFVRLIVIKCD